MTKQFCVSSPRHLEGIACPILPHTIQSIHHSNFPNEWAPKHTFQALWHTHTISGLYFRDHHEPFQLLQHPAFIIVSIAVPSSFFSCSFRG